MKPSDLKEEAERLIANEEMPLLQELMAAIESVRVKYEPKTKAASGSFEHGASAYIAAMFTKSPMDSLCSEEHSAGEGVQKIFRT